MSILYCPWNTVLSPGWYCTPKIRSLQSVFILQNTYLTNILFCKLDLKNSNRVAWCVVLSMHLYENSVWVNAQCMLWLWRWLLADLPAEWRGPEVRWERLQHTSSVTGALCVKPWLYCWAQGWVQGWAWGGLGPWRGPCQDKPFLFTSSVLIVSYLSILKHY